MAEAAVNRRTKARPRGSRAEKDRTQKARELLADVLGRFSEGFQTRDYVRADALLQALSASG
jgi:hypothetical protein